MDLTFKAVVPGTVGLLHTENMICINKTTASDTVTDQGLMYTQKICSFYIPIYSFMPTFMRLYL